MIKKSIEGLFDISNEVKAALSSNTPVVSLESHAVMQGIPFPDSIEIYQKMSGIAKEQGVVPALIGIVDGKIKVGFSVEELEGTIKNKNLLKVNSSAIASSLSQMESGGTTISSTACLSHLIGIDVFVAGGIGGVHHGSRFDISADLFELAKNPILLVCSGAKAILDLPSTVELLETLTIPVIGYQTDTYPGFFLRDTGIPLSNRVDETTGIVDQYRLHRALGKQTALIVVEPPPEGNSLEEEEYYQALETANTQAQKNEITGGDLTPFLLQQINAHFKGVLFPIIKGVLENNMGLGCEIAKQLSVRE